MKRFFFLCIALLSSISLGSDEKEIRVLLQTEEKLAPLYLGKFQGADLSTDYLKELRSTLQYDLSYNGFSKVLPTNESLEISLGEKDPSKSFGKEIWQNSSALYVVKLEISQKKLNAFVFSTKSQTLKQFKDIPLTGVLLDDRKQIHKLADSIQKALFGIDGIANSYILYSVQTRGTDQANSKWNAEIWQCDWDGNNPHPITSEGSYSITPVIIPADEKHSSDRFLYVSYKVGQPKIYVGSSREKTGKRFVELRGNQLLPSISPKRNKIAFVCDASGRTDLFMQALDSNGTLVGKPVQLYSYPNSTQASSTFSPDGSKIAFVSDKDGSPRIYLIPAIESAKRGIPVLLTKQNKENICPCWSPDGTKLAYSAKTEGVRQIWIYDFDSKEERQLTFGAGNKENPCWAPDSMHIVFNSTDPSSSELYVVNLNQPDAVKITRGQGIKHYPSWGRR